MNGVIIQTSEDLKNLYLQTDITDVSSVQSAISEVSKIRLLIITDTKSRRPHRRYGFPVPKSAR